MTEETPDARERATEEQMTDDERFSLLVSVMGVNASIPSRDERIPEDVPMSAGARLPQEEDRVRWGCARSLGPARRACARSWRRAA